MLFTNVWNQVPICFAGGCCDACFAVKLQKCFVDSKTPSYFSSASGWEATDWISHFEWTVPLNNSSRNASQKIRFNAFCLFYSLVNWISLGFGLFIWQNKLLECVHSGSRTLWLLIIFRFCSINHNKVMESIMTETFRFIKTAQTRTKLPSDCPSTWGRAHNGWVFIFGWTYPLMLISIMLTCDQWLLVSLQSQTQCRIWSFLQRWLQSV